MSLGNRRRLMGKKKTLLPSEFQEVEWIGPTHGNIRLVITNVPAMRVSYVVAEIAKQSVPSKGTVFPTGSKPIHGHGASFWGTLENVDGSSWECSPKKTRTEIFERTEFVSHRVKNDTQGLYVALGYNRSDYVPGQRYFGLEMFDDNDSLIFDGITCYRKSDGKIGIFDILSKAFSGEFETYTWNKGPDVL